MNTGFGIMELCGLTALLGQTALNLKREFLLFVSVTDLYFIIS